jgi:taurine dioxygenase
VTGLDLRLPLDDSTTARIRTAWLEHLVLCFPEQNLSAEQLRNFAATFGELDDNRASPHNRHPDYPDVMLLTNKPANGKPWDGLRSGERWHTDLSTTMHPTSATLLLCKERPSVGGDTMFANQYIAYEALSLGMREMVGRMEAIHDITRGRGSERSPEILAQARTLKPPIVQPAVRTHPETRRKTLYMSHRVRRFKEMSDSESLPILEYLEEHAVQDEFVYRHRWALGDLIVWDNRCLLHKALGDYDMWNQARVMLRASVLGHQSGYLFTGDSIEPLESPRPQVPSAPN